MSELTPGIEWIIVFMLGGALGMYSTSIGPFALVWGLYGSFVIAYHVQANHE